MTLDHKGFEAAIDALMDLNPDASNQTRAKAAITAYLSAIPSGQAPLEGVKAQAEHVALGIACGRDVKDATLNLIEMIRSALLPASAEPVGRQHRIYYEDTGKWSDWRDGKRNTRFDNEFEERPVYASPPASGAVEAGWTVKARAAMQKFVDRVEAGEVRSKRTYAEFKELLAARPPSGRGVEGWRPMESAPKDGTAILALNSRHIAHPPIVVRWRAESILGDDAEPHWCDAATPNGGALYYNSLYFDCWQPLPAAPTEGR